MQNAHHSRDLCGALRDGWVPWCGALARGTLRGDMEDAARDDMEDATLGSMLEDADLGHLFAIREDVEEEEPCRPMSASQGDWGCVDAVVGVQRLEVRQDAVEVRKRRYLWDSRPRSVHKEYRLREDGIFVSSRQC